MLKKITLSILAIFLANAFAFSQCSKTYTGTGVYPPQLPDAYEQVQFSQEVDFTFPVDTTVQSFSVHIDSLHISKVVGFPGTNFTFNCNVQNCSYIYQTGMTYYQGCFMIKGTAPKGTAGTYKLKVDLEGYFSTPFGQQTYIVTDSSVNFTVKSCNTSAAVSVTGNTSFCQGGSVKLTASGANKFQWLNMNTPIVNDTLSILYATDSGIYKAIVWDAATGCFDTTSATTVTVYVLPAKPTISATASAVSTTASGLTYQWYRDTTLVANATSQTYTPTVNGKYKLKVTNSNGCSSFSDPLDFKNTSISDLSGIQSLGIFPNPANNTITLEFASTTKQTVQLYIIDINGKVVMTQNINAANAKNNINIDLTNFAKGIYLVKLQTNNGQQTQRLTVD
ncbi:MAG: T9SS type A sorting domain-containing protein [Bacteroidota bacterium]|nr:T9SS type A sorting domain-containing protein [Bacteroidota bacterium]